MNIKNTDLVLEVGSGDKPYRRSDILLDKFPDDSGQREASKELITDRPMVIADAQALPFADKTFDYIICSHVLEHAQNPAKVLTELMRVGKAGYIETPSPERERFYSWPYHRWYVGIRDKTLILTGKTSISRKFRSGATGDMLNTAAESNGYKLDNTRIEWRGKIKFRVERKETSHFLKKIDAKIANIINETKNQKKSLTSVLKDKAYGIKQTIIKYLFLQKKRKTIDLMSLLVCPSCKSELLSENEKLICLLCHREYKLYRKKIPFYDLSIASLDL